MKNALTHRRIFFLLLAAGVAVLVFLVMPMVGMKTIPWSSVIGDRVHSLDAEIFWRVRLPRICLGFLAGGGLAVSGMAFQAMFRNPLATPFTLGVSSGAALGATLYIRMGWFFAVSGISGLALSAFLGALLSILLVYGITRTRRNFSTTTMLLAGVAAAQIFSSLIIFLQYTSDVQRSFRMIRWLMGGLETVGMDAVWSLLPFIVTGSAFLLFLREELNLLTIGEETAASRGVNVQGAKVLLFLATSFMVGGIVSVCGPIGFVGLIVPHICRLIIGPDHVHLMPACFLSGGIFLALCDTLSRTLIAPAEIPAGVITALLGGPFFLWLLLRGVE